MEKKIVEDSNDEKLKAVQAAAMVPMLRFLETLPKKGGVELTLIKCHLLIEETLNELIVAKMVHPNFYLAADFTFSRKVSLARALHDMDDLGWCWHALKKLTEARNKLAHRLDQKEIEQKLEEFLEFVEGHEGAKDGELITEAFGRFHWAVMAVYGRIAVKAHFILHPLPHRTLLGG